MSNHLLGELSGDHPETRLFAIVRPLISGKKSGMVLIKGMNSGELHIEGGRIIHAKTGYSSGEQAVLDMMDWGIGRVTFDWEATAEERTVTMATEQLLGSWTNREEEWKKIREAISSPGVAFRIPIESSPEDRQIQGDQWKVLALSNGTRTVTEIADALKWDLFKTSKTIYLMVQAGLLEKASERTEAQRIPEKRYVNGNFFPILENELKKVMGPIAPIILDDKIAEFGESRDMFPADQTETLVRTVGEEISDTSKKTQFMKVMSEFLTKNQL